MLALWVALLKGWPVVEHLLLMFVSSFAELAWLSKDDPNPLQPTLVHVWINMAAAEREVPFVFWM